ncbi:AAA family ATPase [Deinococcus sp. RM]|uniref:AAA family ATPase n=1 Tax=Deinococcus sp. RM TaxID=2316359 RepID=UPI001313E4C2|nr:AAA family ATPase [Deinococcus sp. RM]
MTLMTLRRDRLAFGGFFTFAILTQFRVRRSGSKGPIFIFDEPASNLHQTYQKKLLISLENLVNSSDSMVIYATHSHHLISSNRLDRIYIIKNAGLKISSDLSSDRVISDITIEKYRTFVNDHPEDKDYFQPILDILEYAPSDLESLKNAVILEGKYDFFTLRLFLGSDLEFDLIPGFGVSRLDILIKLYYGWGREYLVLIDLMMQL